MLEHPYTVIMRQDDGRYVALCLELNVASQGDTVEEARQNINEAIVEYLGYRHESGTEDQIEPVPFEVLKEFLVEGMGDEQQAQMEVLALAA